MVQQTSRQRQVQRAAQRRTAAGRKVGTPTGTARKGNGHRVFAGIVAVAALGTAYYAGHAMTPRSTDATNSPAADTITVTAAPVVPSTGATTPAAQAATQGMLTGKLPTFPAAGTTAPLPSAPVTGTALPTPSTPAPTVTVTATVTQYMTVTVTPRPTGSTATEKAGSPSATATAPTPSASATGPSCLAC